jgi:predicted nuclease of predicted toxin-antitoxin system
MFGATDREVLRRALVEDRVLVTANVADFMKLPRSVELHGGIVLIEDGDLTRDEQEKVLEEAIVLIQAELDAARDMVNRVLYIARSGVSEFDDVPRP